MMSKHTAFFMLFAWPLLIAFTSLMGWAFLGKLGAWTGGAFVTGAWSTCWLAIVCEIGQQADASQRTPDEAKPE